MGCWGSVRTPNIEHRTPNFEVLHCLWPGFVPMLVSALPLFRNSVFGVLLFDICEGNTEYRISNTEFRSVALGLARIRYNARFSALLFRYSVFCCSIFLKGTPNIEHRTPNFEVLRWSKTPVTPSPAPLPPQCPCLFSALSHFHFQNDNSNSGCRADCPNCRRHTKAGR